MPPTPCTEMPGTPYTEILTPLPKRQIRSISATAVWEEAPVFASATIARTPGRSPISNNINNTPITQPRSQSNRHQSTISKLRSGSTLPSLLFQSPGDVRVGGRLRRNKSDASWSSGGEGGEDGGEGGDREDRGGGGGGDSRTAGTLGNTIRIHIDSPLSAARPGRQLPRDRSWSSLSSRSASSSSGFAIPSSFASNVAAIAKVPPLQANRIFTTIASEITTQTLL